MTSPPLAPPISVIAAPGGFLIVIRNGTLIQGKVKIMDPLTDSEGKIPGGL